MSISYEDAVMNVQVAQQQLVEAQQALMAARLASAGRLSDLQAELGDPDPQSR